MTFSYPWRESAEYILLTRAGAGGLIASLWGVALWLIDGAPIRRSTIEQARRDVLRDLVLREQRCGELFTLLARERLELDRS